MTIQHYRCMLCSSKPVKSKASQHCPIRCKSCKKSTFITKTDKYASR